MPVRKILPKTPLSLQPTAQVENVNDPYVQKAIRDLLDTLADHQQVLDRQFPGKGMGVGLAANQIEYPAGEYPKNFIPPNLYVVSIRPERAKLEGCTAVPPSIYINADFLSLVDAKDGAPKQDHHEEGCLSINGVKGFSVPRHHSIQLVALNEHSESISIIAEGFVARVHQHEIDHGRGEEYLNRMNFSKAQLQHILMWIDQHPTQKMEKLPLWIIPGQLQCVTENPDLHSLATWVQAALKKSAAAMSPGGLFSQASDPMEAAADNSARIRSKL